ncbi:hypothetical protein HMPREF9578_01496 [Cutibacterium acnes HL110PA4]|nr:hypothetical protein HMPREF9578_01496 [Cutibacterium acnes HL110PA4]EFT76607.1 hypothetical protein HMPREF9599_02176 [Cutibacterium acnes HL050PA2]
MSGPGTEVITPSIAPQRAFVPGEVRVERVDVAARARSWQ